MWLVDPKEMAGIEQRYLSAAGLTLSDLMIRAGRSLADEVLKEEKAKRIVVLTGKGNNGGDGFICARELSLNGRDVTVISTAAEEQLTVEAKQAFQLLKKTPLKMIPLPTGEPKSVQKVIERADAIVDAVFGIGFKGTVGEPVAGLLKSIAQTEALKIAADVPSGIEADTGRVNGPVFKADKTVTFICPKVGLMVGQGKEHTGTLVVSSLGIPSDIIEKMSTKRLLTEKEVACLLPKRAKDVHKKACGRVFVLAGSVGMTGAAYLTSQAAIRSGAGLVTLGIPASLNDIMEVKLTEVMTLPLPETEDRSLSIEGLEQILESSERFDLMVLGPGLSLNSTTPELVLEIVARSDRPLVLDADGLNALAGRTDILKKRTWPTIITPHPGELARLLQVDAKQIQSDRLGTAQAAAQAWGSVVVLKGTETIIADGKQTAVNPTGNPGMATAGTGDVLTGLIAGLWAQGMNPFEAACTGVYLHGLAGNIAAEDLTEYSLTASDVLDYVSEAFFETTGAFEKWIAKTSRKSQKMGADDG